MASTKSFLVLPFWVKKRRRGIKKGWLREEMWIKRDEARWGKEESPQKAPRRGAIIEARK